MNNNTFNYTSYCEFAIISSEVTPETITELLNIIPDRLYKKGDTSVSKHSGSLITKLNNLWAISSKKSTSKNESISHHIKYIRVILNDKLELISKFKNDKKFELIFSVWIDTDDAGIGLDFLETELSFIDNISHRVHLSLICKGSK